MAVTSLPVLDVLTLPEDSDDTLLVPTIPAVTLKRFDCVETRLTVDTVPEALLLLSLVPLLLDEIVVG